MLLNRIGRFFEKRTHAPVRKVLANVNTDIWNDPLVRQCYEQLGLGRREIDTCCESEDISRQLTDRVIQQWQKLGAAEPYWSNLPSENHLLRNIDSKHIEDFYATGHQDIRFIEAFESRCNVSVKGGTCVELGAGAGRHTERLAKRFDRVIAVDVSERLLELNKERMDQIGAKNVDTYILRSPEAIGDLGPIDFFMARSVLPLNTPPIQRIILEGAMRNMRPGALTWFETPDWLPGYTFSSAKFLAEASEADCDCHCFPKTEVLKMLRAFDLELLDFHSSFYTEVFGCYFYFARKR